MILCLLDWKGSMYCMSTDPFTLRYATEDDIPLLLSMIRALAAYEQMQDQVVATPELLREWMFQKQKAEALLAFYADEAVGFALFFHNFSTFLGRAGLYLEDLYVAPAYRGRGYGKRILKALSSIACARGCGRLEWWCLDWNENSIGFYRSLGAVPMSDWTVYRLAGDTLLQLALDAPVPDCPAR